MKRLLIAAALTAFASTIFPPGSAFAQGVGQGAPGEMRGGRGHKGANDYKKEDDTRPKVDEQAYKAALEKIPVPKEKVDPWGGVRETKTK